MLNVFKDPAVVWMLFLNFKIEHGKEAVAIFGIIKQGSDMTIVFSRVQVTSDTAGDLNDMSKIVCISPRNSGSCS